MTASVWERLGCEPAELQAWTERVAVAAGAMLVERRKRLTPDQVRQKEHLRDLVTDADLASEAFITAALRERFPTHSLYAEEHAPVAKDDRIWWFVDPLDGTVNYAHGLPFVAVSLGLYVDTKPVLAVVHAPFFATTWSATLDHGASKNGQPIRVSDRVNLGEALMATGFAYQRNQVRNNNVPSFISLILTTRDIRRCGSAAIDLAYLAEGVFDGFWEPYLGPYDVAAGALLVREAGGVVSDYAGGEDWLFGETILASNGRPAIQSALREACGRLDEGYVSRHPRPAAFAR